MPGTLALIGGGEWAEGCDFDAALLEASGGDEVAVLPAGAAYEHPGRAVERAAAWFGSLGARVVVLPVLTRHDALDPVNEARVRDARFVYLCGESPMHLRSVLLHSPVWRALVEGYASGAVLAGTAAGAMVLCDPMVDPRGGAFTLGLGLVSGTAVIPHHDTWSEDKVRRTEQIAPDDVRLVGLDTGTALICRTDGTWTSAGRGTVSVRVGGAEAGLDQLAPPTLEPASLAPG